MSLGDLENVEDNLFIKDTGLHPAQFLSGLLYLESTGLVEKNGNSFTITEKGMKVAHEREIASQQMEKSGKTNQAVGYLTVGLVLVNFFGIAINVGLSVGVGDRTLGLWMVVCFLTVLSLGAYGIYIGLIGRGYYSRPPENYWDNFSPPKQGEMQEEAEE